MMTDKDTDDDFKYDIVRYVFQMLIQETHQDSCNNLFCVANIITKASISTNCI